MVYLKELMQNGQVHIPYDRELINQLNVEQYEMMKTGQIRFKHPTGTHDDKLLAFALAVYASRPEVPEYHPGCSRKIMEAEGQSQEGGLGRKIQNTTRMAVIPTAGRAFQVSKSPLLGGSPHVQMPLGPFPIGVQTLLESLNLPSQP